jgi:hypothetical protein
MSEQYNKITENITHISQQVEQMNSRDLDSATSSDRSRVSSALDHSYEFLAIANVICKALVQNASLAPDARNSICVAQSSNPHLSTSEQSIYQALVTSAVSTTADFSSGFREQGEFTTTPSYSSAEQMSDQTSPLTQHPVDTAVGQGSEGIARSLDAIEQGLGNSGQEFGASAPGLQNPALANEQHESMVISA